MKYCAMCHGQDGLQVPVAPLGRKSWLGSKATEFLVVIIAGGKTSGGMPAWGLDYGGFMAREEILAIVQYLRSIAQ